MEEFTRRGFAGSMMAGLSAAAVPRRVLAAVPCAASGMPALLPNQLAVNCASRQNFRLFRRYSGYVGLTGVVSVIDAKGPSRSYRSGNLFLFLWLKPKGLALRNAPLEAAFPTGPSSSAPVQPIPGSVLPQDEYFCRFVLEAPWQSFIGFSVDTPIAVDKGLSAWVSNVPKLADGQGVGIDWTSSNLNRNWFGGRNAIPNDDACHGNAWRSLILNGLNEVSTGGC